MKADPVRKTFSCGVSEVRIILAAHDARLELTFGLVLTTSLICSIYASIDARGQYQDGVEHLYPSVREA